MNFKTKEQITADIKRLTTCMQSLLASYEESELQDDCSTKASKKYFWLKEEIYDLELDLEEIEGQEMVEEEETFLANLN